MALRNLLTTFLVFFLSSLVLGSAVLKDYGIDSPFLEATNLSTQANAPGDVRNIANMEFSFKNDTSTAEQLNKTFSALMSVPDSVLEEGDEAATKWLFEHGYRDVNTPDLAAAGWWQDTKCALAIAAFVGSNLISAAKILRIKKYIEALGGVAEAAELLLKASSWAERLALGGAALVNLVAEILGVEMIKDACT